MNNIKNIYQHAGKCDDQQNLRDIVDADMVSTLEEIKDDITNLPMTQTTVKGNVLSNQYVFSLTYLMLKRKQQNVVLELRNKNT